MRDSGPSSGPDTIRYILVGEKKIDISICVVGKAMDEQIDGQSRTKVEKNTKINHKKKHVWNFSELFLKAVMQNIHKLKF